jgi:DNA polymerase-1
MTMRLVIRREAPPRGPLRVQDHHVLQTPEQVQWLENYLARTREIVSLDTETRNCEVGEESPVGKARATCATIATSEYPNLYLDNYGEYEGNIRVLKRWLADETKPKVGHNLVPFDKHVLANHGLTLNGVYADTLTMDFLLDTSRAGRHSVESAVEDWLGEKHDNYRTTFQTPHINKNGQPSVAKKVLQPHTWWWDQGHHEKVDKYACKDTRITLKLFEHHRRRLEDTPWSTRLGQSYWDFYKRFTMPYAEVLWRMERRGILVDIPYLEECREYFTELSTDAERQFFGGLAELGLDTKYLEKFNSNSSKQLAELVYDHLGYECTKWTGKNPGEGQRSTDKETLELLVALGCAPLEPLLDGRKVKKLLSTYVEAMLRLAPQYGGRIHTGFNQIGAVTGRLSSSNPNLQNVPARTELGQALRRAFVAGPGRKIIDLDLAQIEMRIMAHRSQDPVMLWLVRKDYDMHAMSLYFVDPDVQAATDAEFGAPSPIAEAGGMAVPSPEALKWIKGKFEKQRARAKNFNFSIQYGATAVRAAVTMGCTVEQGQEAIDRYMGNYVGAARFFERQREKARANGYVRTLLGRYCHLPHATSRSFGMRKAAERQAVNYDIQGSAADVIMMAMLLCDADPELERLGAELHLQVHDELLFTGPSENADRIAKRAKQLMEDPYSPFGIAPMTVPTAAEAGIGYDWLSAH